jgi:hypothetical protein
VGCGSSGREHKSNGWITCRSALLVTEEKAMPVINLNNEARSFEVRLGERLRWLLFEFALTKVTKHMLCKKFMKEP